MRLFILKIRHLPKIQRIFALTALFLGVGMFIFGISYQMRLVFMRAFGVETMAVIADVSEPPERFTGAENKEHWYTFQFRDEDNVLHSYAKTRKNPLVLNQQVPIVYNKLNPSSFVDAKIISNPVGTQLLWSLVGGIILALSGVFISRSRSSHPQGI